MAYSINSDSIDFSFLLDNIKSFISDSVQVFSSGSSFSFHLHNSGIRPTVYQVSFSKGKHSFELDTIVHENKSHKCIKVFGEKNYILNIIIELISQSSDGSLVDTKNKFLRIGSLYSKIK